ncbi:MAG: universal stress protein [Cytophagaceae bacterium]
MKPKKILVPTDFSKNSINALEYAAKLAEKYKAKIILYHIYQAVLINTDLRRNKVTFDIHETEDVAKEKLEKLVKNIKKKCPDISYTYKIAKGTATKEINKEVVQNDIDMIVIGTRGAGAIGSLFFGSFAAEIIEHAPCPVLAIPEKAEFTSFKTVVFATEFNRRDISSLAALSVLLSPFESTIKALHVTDDPSAKMEKIMHFEKEVKERTKGDNIHFELINNDEFLDGLFSYIEKSNADMLVMSTRKRKFLERIYDRSMTKIIAYQTDIPLFALHSKE